MYKNRGNAKPGSTFGRFKKFLEMLAPLKMHGKSRSYQVLFFLAILACIPVLVPFPVGAQKATPAGPVSAPSTLTSLQGRVLMKGLSKGLEFASVALLRPQDSALLSGTLTRSGGYFVLDKVVPGAYLLELRYLGCSTVYLPVQAKPFNPANPVQELGNLTLQEDATRLQTVEVTESRQSTVLAIDRKVYTVDKDLTAKGASALEVMRNLPGVTTEADGSVRLRNATPQIFVDGRPTVLTLEQIPAEQIDRIEIITNPSVKFDANTTGGLLNVVLKKASTPGYQGSVNGGAGTGRRWNSGVNLNLKEDRSAWSLSYNFSDFLNPLQNSTLRQNLQGGIPTQTFLQNSKSELGRRFQMGRLGWDFQINQRSTLTTALSVGRGRFRNTDQQPYSWTKPGTGTTNDTLVKGEQVNDQTNFWNYGSAQVMLRKTTGLPGEEWTVDLNYNASSNGTDATWTNQGDSLIPATIFKRTQSNSGRGQNQTLTLQYDHTMPGENGKWEWGLRSNLRKNNSRMEVLTAWNQQPPTPSSDLSNQFVINDLVQAAYLNRQWKWGPWGLQAGLRLEQTRFEVTLPDRGDSSFSYRYPEGGRNWGNALFPGIYLSRKVGAHELQFNLSRKIGRPGFFQVLPFILFADAQGFRVGNPGLAPEFYHLSELNHQVLRPTYSLNTTWYNRYTTQVITEFVAPLPGDSVLLRNSYINGQGQFASGLEHSFRWNPDKRWTLTGNGNVFYTQVRAGAALGNASREGWSWTAKGQVAFKANARWSFQWNGDYEAPRILPQGRTYPAYGMDLSVACTWNKAWSGILQLSDLANTRRFGNTVQNDLVFQEFIRRREVRFLRLTLTYRFGNAEASLFQRFRKAGSGGGGGMDMGF